MEPNLNIGHILSDVKWKIVKHAMIILKVYGQKGS